MSLALLPVALLAASALYAAASALWRRTHRGRPPHRTPADVLADAAAHRAARDLATCQAIWPDAHRAARIADTQHRLDRRKEKDR